jgi:hypothetical protein
MEDPTPRKSAALGGRPTLVSQRDVIWEWLDRPGLEHLRLTTEPTGIRAESLVVTAIDGVPLRLEYQLTCDCAWRFRAAELSLGHAGAERDLRIECRDGTWELDGRPRADLSPAVDIDIMATPFTNTLPVRRLAPWPDEAVEMTVAWVMLPTLKVRPVRQSYRRLAPGDPPSRLEYRNLESGFTAALGLDADGLVTHYGGVWRRRDGSGLAGTDA